MSADLDVTVARSSRWEPAVAVLVLRAMDGQHVIDELPLEDARSTQGILFAATLTWGEREPVGDDVWRWPATLDVECIASSEVEAGLVVAMPLAGTGEPRWLIPGLFYGQNRPAECRRLFPRFAAGPPDAASFASDHWTFRVDRAASPVVIGWVGDAGVALATTELGPLGRQGLGFAGPTATTAITAAAGAPGARGEVRLAFPYREEPMVYDGSETPRSPETPVHRWEPGEHVRLTFSAYRMGRDVGSSAPVLRDVHARLAVDAPLNPWMGIDEAAGLAAEGLVRWHYRDVAGGVLYETAAFERPIDGVDAPGDRAAMHVGWVSGIPAAGALLRHGRRTGDVDMIAAGAAVIDTIVAHPAPCGTLWGQWSAERGWGKGWTPGEDRLHTRTIAEAVTFLLRAIDREHAAGIERPAWRAAAAANLAFISASQRDDGLLPASWNGRSGQPASWSGSAGLAWVPALVAGSSLLADPRLLEAARRAGQAYAPFVERGFLHGAPEDVDLAPTSEDGYLAVMAYVALVEAAADAEERLAWLDLARRAADWTLTFRYSWNVAFDPRTILGAYGFRSLGADQASPANQHLHAYGLVCLPEMARLAVHAGDPHYLARTRENLACFRQFLARTDGDFNARRGMAPERLYQTACFGPKGGIGALSHAWVLGLVLHGCEEALVIPELADAD